MEDPKKKPDVKDIKKPPKPPNKKGPQVPETVVQHMEEIVRQLRLLEERCNGLRKKVSWKSRIC